MSQIPVFYTEMKHARCLAQLFSEDSELETREGTPTESSNSSSPAHSSCSTPTLSSSFSSLESPNALQKELIPVNDNGNGNDDNDGKKGFDFEENNKNINRWVLVPMSLDNGYFSTKRLPKLFKSLLKEYPGFRIAIIVCDAPAKHNYQGIYAIADQKEAFKRAIKRGKNLKRACKKAMKELTNDEAEKCVLIDWASEIDGHPEFKASMEIVHKLSQDDDNSIFQEVQEGTYEYIKTKLKPNLTEDDKQIAIRKAMGYGFEEIGFVAAAPNIFEDVDRMVLIYHRPWKFMENMLAGKYGQISQFQQKVSFRCYSVDL